MEGVLVRKRLFYFVVAKSAFPDIGDRGLNSFSVTYFFRDKIVIFVV